MHHAETYFKLISAIDPKKLKLTKYEEDKVEKKKIKC